MFWVFRMINTYRPLQEKISLFWHGILCAGFVKVDHGRQMNQHIDMFRRHGMGDYRNLLVELSRHPTMVYYLDNCENHKDSLNENYWRELLELFSLGVGMDGQFNLTWGLTIDSMGNLYVADWRNDRIQKFTANGEYLAEFGSSGNRTGEFNRPTGVAVDKYGDIYVADCWNDRVQVLTPDGRHITTFTGDGGLSKWGPEKLEANPDMKLSRSLVRDLEPERPLWRPNAVTIDHTGRVLILDSNYHRIQIYQKENY